MGISRICPLTIGTNIPNVGSGVAKHVLVTFNNNAGVTELGGTVNNFSLTWSYNRNSDDPTSQTINQGIGAVPVGDRSFAVVGAGLTNDTTYTINAVGDDGTPSALNTTIQFSPMIYWGPYDAIISTDVEVLANLSGSEFRESRPFTKIFDASVGSPPNYLYFCFPVSFGAPVQTLFNDFIFNDYTQTTIVGFTNGSGFSQDYYLLRTNNQYSGPNLKWEIQ